MEKNELVNPGFNYGTEDDYHLRFFPPGELEIIRNAQNFDVKFEDYRPRSEFSYLKEGFLNLEEMRLTDKQLMAVSLVFYGGLKKSSLDESWKSAVKRSPTMSMPAWKKWAMFWSKKF